MCHCDVIVPSLTPSAGVKKNIFDDTAITAIHQGSGGLFRKANYLGRGAAIELFQF